MFNFFKNANKLKIQTVPIKLFTNNAKFQYSEINHDLEHKLRTLHSAAKDQIEKKQYEIAMKYLDEMLEHDTNNEFALTEKGRIFFHQGNYTAAERCLTQAIEANHLYQEPKELLHKTKLAKTETSTEVPGFDEGMIVWNVSRK